MNVFEAITTAAPTTEFHRDVVDEKMVGLILHIGTHALSAGDLQEWEFVVVEDDEVKAELSEAALGLSHVKKAPVVIVICADLRKTALKYGKRGERVYAIEDVGGCANMMAIAANALGLGFDFVKSFDEDDVKNLLGLPENIRPLIIMPLGRPKGPRKARSVNQFENLTHVNKYGHKVDIEFKPVLSELERLLGRK